MNKRIFSCALLAHLLLVPAQAQAMRELQQDELRANVEAGKTQSLATIMKVVQRSVDGEIVDVRAFDSDGIYYQVLVMLPGGKLASVVLDAASGTFLERNSKKAALVQKFAKSNPSKSNNGKSATAGSNGNANGKSKKKDKKDKSKGKSKGKK